MLQHFKNFVSLKNKKDVFAIIARWVFNPFNNLNFKLNKKKI